MKTPGPKQFSKNLASLTAVQVAVYVLPLISVPIISRIIGPGRFGTINVAAAYVTYFTLFVAYSFEFSGTRRISKNHADVRLRNQVFSEVISCQLLLLLISTIVFGYCIATVDVMRKNSVVFLSSFLVCISTPFTQNWFFQAMGDLSKVALFNFLSRLIFTISIILIVRKPEDYFWQPLLIGIIQLGMAVWSLVWAIKKYQIEYKIPSLYAIYKVLRSEATIFLALIFVNIYSATNITVLSKYRGDTEVGFFAAAQRLIMIAQSVFVIPFSQAFYPYIGRSFAQDKQKGVEKVQRVLPVLIIALTLASLGLIVFGPFVITTFYGSDFKGAIIAFELLTLVPLLFAMNNMLGIQVMFNINQEKYFMVITAAAALFNVIANHQFARTFGLIGTSLTWLGTELLMFLLMYISLSRKGISLLKPKYFAPNEMLNTLRNR